MNATIPRSVARETRGRRHVLRTPYRACTEAAGADLGLKHGEPLMIRAPGQLPISAPSSSGYSSSLENDFRGLPCKLSQKRKEKKRRNTRGRGKVNPMFCSLLRTGLAVETAAGYIFRAGVI